MKQIIFLILICLFSFYSVLSCSLKPHYLSVFDKTEYIFIGEVVGYTNLLKSKNRISNLKTHGLIVKVKEAVNLPKTPKTHFEVLPLQLGGACETLGISLNQLEEDYPINSEILVTIREATVFPHILNDGNFRLEYKWARFNVININKDKNNSSLTNANSIISFDNIKTYDDYEDKYFLFDFESRKELKRLSEVKTQSEMEQVINNLLKNPTDSINFLELLKLNIKSTEQVLKLYEARLRFENEFWLKIDNKESYSEEEIQNQIKEAKKKLNTKSLKP